MAKKTPKNLKETLKEKDSVSNFTLEHMFDPSFNPYDHIGKDKNIFESMEYQVHYNLSQLARDIAKDTLGYSHSSDILDDAPESTFRDFANPAPVSYSSDSSSDYEEESESTLEPRWDYYDEVKNTFKSRLDESLGTGSYQNYESFKELLKIATNFGFSGDANEFERILKNSSTFRDFAKDETTRYTG